MFDEPILHQEKSELLGIATYKRDEDQIPTLLLVGTGRPLHPVMMDKLLAMEAAGTIRIAHHSLEYAEPRKVDVLTWFDECSQLPSPYIVTYGVKPLREKERKPKPYYRTKERY